jgi:hypothetical protein
MAELVLVIVAVVAEVVETAIGSVDFVEVTLPALDRRTVK